MLLLLGIPLLAIMAGLTAYGFSQLQHGQSHGFLNWLENAAESSLLFVVPLAEQALKLTSWLTRMLGQYFEGTFVRVVHFVAGINTYLQVTARVALTWPIELFRVQERLVWHTIPRLIQAAIKGIGHEAHAAVTILKPIERIVYRVPKISRAAARTALAAVLPIPLRQSFGLLSWLRTHLKALAHLLAHPGISVPFPGVDWEWLTHGKIGRVTRDIQKRLALLQAIVAGVAGVGLLAKAMQRMGINWIRCNNVKKIGKLLCGSPAWIINLLAAGVVESFIVTDLCGYTDLLIKEAERFVPSLMALVDVEDALIGCHGTVKPIEFALPALSLPPMPEASALAA